VDKVVLGILAGTFLDGRSAGTVFAKKLAEYATAVQHRTPQHTAVHCQWSKAQHSEKQLRQRCIVNNARH
jgi:hypothetical protein